MNMQFLYQSEQREVVSAGYGDVNGDGIEDYVFLTAISPRDTSSSYVEQIRLNIEDGATGKVYTILLDQEGDAGYQPTIFLGDFTGDGVMNILITIDSGGSGALTYDYVFSFVNNQSVKMFDFNAYNEKNEYAVTYLNYYKVRIESAVTGQAFLLTIRDRGEDYLSQIYDEDETLRGPVAGMFDEVSGFYPVDMDYNGVYEIQAYQQISGLYHADSFGYIINTLQWDGEKFVISQQWFAMFGESEES
ncbi:MAG TPA: VCBS repeat-containing protein [Pseudogracilibacillus sp.]|nr:VCBS repeat-containing protein [Pseudogracilibacillus sp.]